MLVLGETPQKSLLELIKPKDLGKVMKIIRGLGMTHLMIKEKL